MGLLLIHTAIDRRTKRMQHNILSYIANKAIQLHTHYTHTLTKNALSRTPFAMRRYQMRIWTVESLDAIQTMASQVLYIQWARKRVFAHQCLLLLRMRSTTEKGQWWEFCAKLRHRTTIYNLLCKSKVWNEYKTANIYMANSVEHRTKWSVESVSRNWSCAVGWILDRPDDGDGAAMLAVSLSNRAHTARTIR